MKSRMFWAAFIAVGVFGSGCGLQLTRQEDQPPGGGLVPGVTEVPLASDEIVAAGGKVVSAEVEGILRSAELDLEQQIVGVAAEGPPVRVQCKTL